MANAFKQPPKGPVIGPMQDFTTLPDHRKEQLGDLAQLGAEVISQPAPLDPRVSAEAQEAAEAALVEEDVPASKKSPEEIADELEALQAVLAEDIPDEPDPIDVAAEPLESDRRNFLRSILGDKQYEKEYVLFGGMLIVKMTDISPEQEDGIFAQLAVDQREESIKTQEDWELQLDRYRAVVNVKYAISSGTAIDKNQSEDLKEKVAELCRTKNSTVYRAILRTVRVFRRHLDLMMEKSMQSDFWQVDGLSSPSEPTRPTQSDMTEPVAQEVGI